MRHDPPPPIPRAPIASVRTAPFTRGFWVVAHRWAGLTLALFLTIAGVTGAVLPFEEPLGYATRPDAARIAPPMPEAHPLDGITIARRVERQTGGRIAYMPLVVPADHPLRLFVGPRAGKPKLGYDTVWADPYSGRVRLTYTFGGVRDGAQNIVPFLYTLHYGFVAGRWGVIVFGIAALVWTIDCFVGFGLSLPTGAGGRLVRFRHAFAVRRRRGYKLTFDLHRAGGLWLWPLLLVFAWSGVALALPQVETPVRKLLGGGQSYVPTPLPHPVERSPIDAFRAVARGEHALAAIGRRQGFTVERAAGLSYDPASATWRLYARTSLDPSSDDGRTTVTLDAQTGRVLDFEPPTGRAAADATVTWFEMLHMARVWGLPWRIAVSAIGLAVAMLSVTGVLIWHRKRGARLLHRARMIGPRRRRAMPVAAIDPFSGRS